MSHTLSTSPAKKAPGPTSHAILPASASHRWLNCTASARLEEAFGIKTETSYATEGTLAHSIGALFLERDVLHKTDDFNVKLESLMADKDFTEDMLGYVDQYIDYCLSQIAEYEAKGITVYPYVEQKLDLKHFIPEGFGTTDFGLVADTHLEIVDFKYGMGVPVYAEYNSQLMIYALGLLYQLSDIYDIQDITVTIVQPRINNISSFDISAKDLLDWATNTLIPKAKEAFAGGGEPVPGEWCKFCSIKTRCRKQYEEQLKIAKADFSSDPRLLSDEDIADIVKRSKSFITWINAVTEYAQSEAVNNNKQWPGLKLVAGRSTRKWIDEDLAESTVRERCPEIPDNVLYTTKFNTLTAIEKAIGKTRFATLFADIVVKPEGTPTLVPEDDPREAIGISQAQRDFAE